MSTRIRAPAALSTTIETRLRRFLGSPGSHRPQSLPIRGTPVEVPGPRRNNLHLEDAIMLFRRLGVDVQSLLPHEFTRAYFRLAKRYHPDQGNRNSHELMAHINAARTVILNAHSFDEDRS